MTRYLLLAAAVFATAGCRATENGVRPAQEAPVVRVATYNIEDVRATDLRGGDNPRLRRAAEQIQRLRPDVLLISEMSFDQPGAPGYVAGEPSGQNGRRFVENYLAVPQAPGLAPIRYQAFAAPTNTGLSSGLDLDNDGRIVREIPAVPAPGPDGAPAPQTPEGRAYGNDAWGFGTFPGQYGMVLLVREGLDILEDSVRTFRLLPWSRMPGATPPVHPETGEAWYTPEEWAVFRLSSKSHWDVPVRLEDGTVLHVLASHPTPPAFDGPERRNVLRNRAEIAFWADYLNGASYIVDDAGQPGGLAAGAPFVIVGDLNADPDEGRSMDDPVGTLLLAHPRVHGIFVPQATAEGVRAYPDLDPDDTARWGLRVDYVLPSAGMQVVDGRIERPAPDAGVDVSDHFMVWLDLRVPSEAGAR